MFFVFHREKKMKLKELESHLSNVENFSNAKEYLEQYMTTPHLGNFFLNYRFISFFFVFLSSCSNDLYSSNSI
jgi:hypothetical protein